MQASDNGVFVEDNPPFTSLSILNVNILLISGPSHLPKTVQVTLDNTSRVTVLLRPFDQTEERFATRNTYHLKGNVKTFTNLEWCVTLQEGNLRIHLHRHIYKHTQLAAPSIVCTISSKDVHTHTHTLACTWYLIGVCVCVCVHIHVCVCVHGNGRETHLGMEKWEGIRWLQYLMKMIKKVHVNIFVNNKQELSPL